MRDERERWREVREREVERGKRERGKPETEREREREHSPTQPCSNVSRIPLAAPVFRRPHLPCLFDY